jgi:PPE-repeat protein
VESNFHCLDNDIDRDSKFQCHSLRSNPFAELISPLHTPRRRHINLVSVFSSDTPAAMAFDARPPGGQNDPSGNKQLANTLFNILAQLTTINKRLELQSETIARHDQLLGAPMVPQHRRHPLIKPMARPATVGGGGGNGNSGDNFIANHHPQHHDFGTNSETLSIGRSSTFRIMMARWIRYHGSTTMNPISAAHVL